MICILFIILSFSGTFAAQAPHQSMDYDISFKESEQCLTLLTSGSICGQPIWLEANMYRPELVNHAELLRVFDSLLQEGKEGNFFGKTEQSSIRLQRAFSHYAFAYAISTLPYPLLHIRAHMQGQDITNPQTLKRRFHHAKGPLMPKVAELEKAYQLEKTSKKKPQLTT